MPLPPRHPATANYLPLVRAVSRGLRERGGVREGDHLVIACSGGADSVALLRALHLLHSRRKWNLSLTVAHVQHHLRPPEAAEGDAVFVAALAERLGLPYRRRDIRPGGEPGNVEANARELRYAALAETAREVGAGFVVTAHHADDQLETLLMAILRGTTAKGLRGIAWQRPLGDASSGGGARSGGEADSGGVVTSGGVMLLRPMLGATHDDAVALLEHLDQPWREDATNSDRSRTRARLRHEVLPVLRELRPSVARKAVELGDSLREGIESPRGQGAKEGKNP
ncbi:MAG: tRNA lysidine(34) synthetase TilS [Planctomycetota bacterium]